MRSKEIEMWISLLERDDKILSANVIQHLFEENQELRRKLDEAESKPEQMISWIEEAYENSSNQWLTEALKNHVYLSKKL